MSDRLDKAALVERYPRLWHMANAGSWPSIRRHGLLSTSALLDLFEVDASERSAIEAQRRTRSITLKHPVHGSAVIRDNLPINETVLRRTLVGMDEEEYYRTLNARVFFWADRRRLEKLRKAGAYADQPQEVLTIDTARLLERHADRVELCHLNSGAVHPAANYPRGAGTFRAIADYPWRERRAVSHEPLVEVTVLQAVPDVSEFVVRLDRA